jgi:hypothetical protein
MKHILSTLVFILIITYSLSAQETYYNSPSQKLYKGNNTNNYDDVSGLPKELTKSQEQINIESQIKSLRLENNTANSNRIEELNQQLSKFNGNVVKPADYYGGGIVQASNNAPFIQPDNFMNTRIFNSSTTVKALATFTEQIGTNAGRIWVVYAFSANTSSPDSLRVLYSDNGGTNYSLYANIWLGGTDKVNFDDLDIEIIENTSGNKYLWGVYGLRSSGGSGNWFTGGFNLNISSFAGSLWALSWPGSSSNNRYYGIRITSDNVVWPGSAWMYIACSYDSTYGSGSHYNSQRYARIISPYTSSSPTFTYMPGNFWWQYSGSTIQRILYTDIAFFRNNGIDSLIVSFSGIPDSTKVFFAKADGNGNPPVTGHFQAGSDASAYKFYARLSSNGNSNGSVICVFNQVISGNRNVKYFRSSNYGDFSSPAQSILWGSSVNTNYQPDIVGRRNANIHYFAFNTIATTDSVHLVSVTSAGGTTHIFKMNSASLLSGTQGTKPGFRFVSGDSCYALYSESGPVNVWSTAGCTGAFTGVGNQSSLPNDYALKQNYPNPFNPSTTIEYSIPKNGLVKLVVYDILGKEVATLVNDVKIAGNYLIDFNASNLTSGIYFYKISSGEFSSVKKMLLIK